MAKSNNPENKPERKKLIPRAFFTQYSTMFKFQTRSHFDMVGDPKPRKLQCVNCGSLLEWRIYTIAPEKFDSLCPDCHMTASEFWEGKLHKELNSNA